jgi:prevent-host-death family protein
VNSTTVSIAEGKKNFSRLIQNTLDKKETIIVTRRGKPVAVIAPYEEYSRTLRMRGYRKIMELRKLFHTVGISAEEIYHESRDQLEERQ